MKTSVNFLFVFLLIFTIFISCEKDKGPIIIRPDIPFQSADTFISFIDDIQPILNEFCIECHNQSHPFLDLRDLYSYNELLITGYSAPYVDTINPSNSLLVGRLYGVQYAIMPPNPPVLSQGKIDTIVVWMRQGARNN